MFYASANEPGDMFESNYYRIERYVFYSIKCHVRGFESNYYRIERRQRVFFHSS